MSLSTMRRRVIGAATVSLLLVACAAPATSTEPVATNQVDLPASYKFVPGAITVPDGTKVTWTNRDNFTHSVRLTDDGGEVKVMKPGESVSFTFHGVGEHRYDCSFHSQQMHGVVIVTAD
jgi:plastocyanin